MSPEQRSAIIVECGQLVVKYGHYGDHGLLYDRLDEIFTEDVEMDKPSLGQSTRGRDKLYETQRGGKPAPADELQRHVISTPCFLEIGETEAKAVTCLTYYRTTAPAGLPALLEGATMIAEYTDHFRRTPEGWRIAKRVVHPALRQQTSAPSLNTPGER